MKSKLANLNNHQTGFVSLIDETYSVKDYVFSNIFDVARKFEPHQRVVVAKNFEYVIEVIRTQGGSPFYIAPHDEFLLVMDGEMTITFWQPNTTNNELNNGASIAKPDTQTIKKMGSVHAKQGHLVLLPQHCIYKIESSLDAVAIIQTIQGELSIEAWHDICQTEDHHIQGEKND